MSMSLLLRIHITILSLHILLLFVNVNSSDDLDPYKILGLTRNSNGTITRFDPIPNIPPSQDPNDPIPALSKDLTINISKNTYARIYLPHNLTLYQKLPLIVYYHGGGFVFYSVANYYFHNFCANLTNQTQSIIVSLNYRLAPEHRLPAAYDDSIEVLHWIKNSNDPWLTHHANYSHCYLMGESAGGNIVYNVGLRAAAIVDDIKPITIKALILIQPFFGGTNRTSSELRLQKDMTLSLDRIDSYWNLSLPLGVDRDYVYSNPMVNGGSRVLDKIRLFFTWKFAVFGTDGDPLVDRQREFMKLLESKQGLKVMGYFYAEGTHGIFMSDPSKSQKALVTVQARARAQRIRMASEGKPNSNQSTQRNAMENDLFRQIYNEMDRSLEDNIKIVEMDFCESKGNSTSRCSGVYNHGQHYEHRYSTNGSYTKEENYKVSPAPSALTELSSKACSGHFEDCIRTAQSSPQCYSAISKIDSSISNHLFSFPRPSYAEPMSYDYPLYPSYMANTESSRAKVRSQSAPKQRPDAFEKQPSRRRISVEGRNVPRPVRMQRSSSHVGAAAQNYQYPWSIKLDRSAVSLKDSECGSTSTMLTNTNYCRSLVAYDPEGDRY